MSAHDHDHRVHAASHVGASPMREMAIDKASQQDATVRAQVRMGTDVHFWAADTVAFFASKTAQPENQ